MAQGVGKAGLLTGFVSAAQVSDRPVSFPPRLYHLEGLPVAEASFSHSFQPWERGYPVDFRGDDEVGEQRRHHLVFETRPRHPEPEWWEHRHLVEELAYQIGVPGPLDLPTEISFPRGAMPPPGTAGKIVLHNDPTTDANKGWPWAYAAEFVRRQGPGEVVLIGSPGPELPGVIDLRGKTRLVETAAIIAACRCYVGSIPDRCGLRRACRCRRRVSTARVISPPMVPSSPAIPVPPTSRRRVHWSASPPKPSLAGSDTSLKPRGRDSSRPPDSSSERVRVERAAKGKEQGAMGRESRKAYPRRLAEGYFHKFFVGEGIDIGCGEDPVPPTCVAWDLEQGDAQQLPGLPVHAFDWVYSSHCLEDLANPWQAVQRWWEVLRPGGHLLVVVPDEDLYQQGCWPSRYNRGHQWTFTIHKTRSWSPVSINLTELAATLPQHQVLRLRTCDQGYDYSGGVWDRTGGAAEAHIELAVRKLAWPKLSGRAGNGRGR